MFFEQKIAKSELEIVTVLADTAFDFPGPELFEKLQREGFGPGKETIGLGPSSGATLAAAFKALLNILARGLSPHGSLGIMNTQVDELCRRFRKYKGSRFFQDDHDQQNSRGVAT